MTEVTQLQAWTIDGWRQARPLAPALGQLAELIARSEPRIHALVEEAERFERLRRDAESLVQGPLAGVPVGVKDIFQVSGLFTRAGSKLPVDELAGPEAVCVGRLRRAGALILGKTVSTEFAYFAPGPTTNPRNPAHSPGGSSSGSAAAVAAGYCPLALGTQTIGSISRPASFCGVVGFKPSFGRISTAGVIPLSPSLDQVGLFTTTVADSAAAAALLCPDWQPVEPAQRPVLGIPEGPLLERASAEGRAHFLTVCQFLESRGWEIRALPAFADFEEIEARHHLIVAAEAARAHRKWYPRFKDLYHAKTRELIERGSEISDSDLAAALPGRQHLRTQLEKLMRRRGIDLWLSPAATGPAPVGLDSTGDPIMNLPWTQAGLPTVSVPAGPSRAGLPMGLQIAGGWRADETLLAWSLELEKALKGL